MTSGLLAGAARVLITPPVGIHLAGFAGRPPSTGVHDDLTATVLVLDGPGGNNDASDKRVALVALDLLGIYDAALAQAIKARITAATGISAERTFLNCSHTHYGPVTGTGQEGAGQPAVAAYHQALPYQIAGAVAAANTAIRPVTLAVARGEVRVGINRRELRADSQATLGHNPHGPLDSEVQVWRLDAVDDTAVAPCAPNGWVHYAAEPVAVVVNYACHGVSLGSRMRQITADFPGVMRGVVEHLVGGTALFLQGAAGNINPTIGFRSPQSTEWTGPWEAPSRLGTALGAEVTRLVLTAQTVPTVPLRTARETVAVPALLPTSGEAGRTQVAALVEEKGRLEREGASAGARWWNAARLRRAKRALAALDGGEPLSPVEAELGALRLGDAVLVTNPAELFCEIGMAIKRASPFTWTAVAAYTDGAIGYVPTPGAYPEGGYEVTHACFVGPEAAAIIEAASVRLLQDLARDTMWGTKSGLPESARLT